MIATITQNTISIAPSFIEGFPYKRPFSGFVALIIRKNSSNRHLTVSPLNTPMSPRKPPVVRSCAHAPLPRMFACPTDHLPSSVASFILRPQPLSLLLPRAQGSLAQVRTKSSLVRLIASVDRIPRQASNATGRRECVRAGRRRKYIRLCCTIPRK